jgi:hypothetical protein
MILLEGSRTKRAFSDEALFVRSLSLQADLMYSAKMRVGDMRNLPHHRQGRE